MSESSLPSPRRGIASPADRIRPLLRTRQVREFRDAPVDPAVLDAVTDAARWSGSSGNEQPWRFVVIRQTDTLRRLAEAGAPQTRSLLTATAAIAIVLPDERQRVVSRAYDEGRAAERILIAASMLEIGGGIAWIQNDARDAVRAILGLPGNRLVRTVVALGHPTEAARRPKSPPGHARLPREQTVIAEHWPA